MKEIRDRARELMRGACRVCPVCDGRACAGEVPGMGGIGTGASFKANLEALARVGLNLRVIHGAGQPDPTLDFFGQRLALPILAAPVAGTSFNLGGGVEEEPYAMTVVEGCLEEGTLAFLGDGAPPIIFAATLAAMKKFGGRAIPVIKPWADAELDQKLAQAAEAGAKLVGMDLDACGLITLSLMGRPVVPRPAPRLRAVIERHPLKFLLKGIMTPLDAELAVEAGAAGIVVSNHGGRVLEAAPGAAEVLPAIARAVGERLVVLADGGVRSGGDVLKLLALGARAVLVGRPLAVAAIGGGAEGVAKHLAMLKGQLLSAMVLTGCANLKAVGPEIIIRREA